MEFGILSWLLLATLMAGTSASGHQPTRNPGKRPVNADRGTTSKRGRGQAGNPGEGSSSQPPEECEDSEQFDKHKFKNARAFEFYKEMKEQDRPWIPERGIQHRHLNDDRLFPLLQHLGWLRLAQHPTDMASQELAYEVFANMDGLTSIDDIYVRGHQIDFSAAAINRFFGLPNAGVIIPPQLYPVPWQILAAPHTVRPNPKDQMEVYLTNIAIPWRCLAQLWHGRIRPTRHDTYLNNHIFEFVHHIATGGTVNIGAQINRHMKEIVTENVAFTYCHLIRDMCEDQGMEFTDEEKSAIQQTRWLAMPTDVSAWGSIPGGWLCRPTSRYSAEPHPHSISDSASCAGTVIDDYPSAYCPSTTGTSPATSSYTAAGTG